jgi:antitoxin VapB
MRETQTPTTEIAQKLAQLRTQMAERGLDAVILERSANIAWLTAGANTDIVLSQETSPLAIAVTADRAIVFADSIEGPRLHDEEDLAAFGFTITMRPWYTTDPELGALLAAPRTGGDHGQAAQDVSAMMQALRTTLQGAEIERMRDVTRVTVEIVQEVIARMEPGMREHEIAGQMAALCKARGGNAIVNLVASDERIAQFRHPLPTAKQVERYAMLVLCCRMRGLVGAVTRLVHFGPLPEELAAKAQAVAQVDAALIHFTQAGKSLGDMFGVARVAYAQVGYPEAIEQHHQGGTIGYLSRERLAKPDDRTPIALNQCFAWNPSVRGVKSEDTILLTANGPEILTALPDWPTWDVTVEGHTYARPAILVR